MNSINRIALFFAAGLLGLTAQAEWGGGGFYGTTDDDYAYFQSIYPIVRKDTKEKLTAIANQCTTYNHSPEMIAVTSALMSPNPWGLIIADSTGDTGILVRTKSQGVVRFIKVDISGRDKCTVEYVIRAPKNDPTDDSEKPEINIHALTPPNAPVTISIPNPYSSWETLLLKFTAYPAYNNPHGIDHEYIGVKGEGLDPLCNGFADENQQYYKNVVGLRVDLCSTFKDQGFKIKSGGRSSESCLQIVTKGSRSSQLKSAAIWPATRLAKIFKECL